MKTLFTFLLSGISLLLCYTQAEACDLNPTAVIDILPDEVVFLVGDSIYMEAYNSSPNCGYISGYRWRVDGVTQSTSGYFIPNLTLQSGEDSRSFDIQLRVRNSVGNYGYERYLTKQGVWQPTFNSRQTPFASYPQSACPLPLFVPPNKPAGLF